jgi:hypothetical protein
MSLGTPLIALVILKMVCYLAVSHITFLNKVPGWVKSQLGWLARCLATNPVILYGEYFAFSS